MTLSRLTLVLAAALLLFTRPGLAQEDKPEPEPADEWTEQEKAVDELLGEDAAEDEADEVPDAPLPPRFDREQDPAYQKKLDQIKLPDNPTREQCEDYVKALEKVVEDKRSFSSNDPEVAMLKALPPEHFDLVFEQAYGHDSLSFYAGYAINQIDPDTIRDPMIDRLKDSPNNIVIIVTHGWVQDAKPVILNQLEKVDSDVQPAWFQAFVEIAEPEHYPTLHKLATRSPHAATFISLLKTLPGYDVNKTIEACWDNRNNQHQINGPFFMQNTNADLAVQAAEIGNLDALEQLIDRLKGNESGRHHHFGGFGGHGGPNQVVQDRHNVTRFIPFRGTNKQIKKWFEKHRDELTFDHFEKRFVIQQPFE